MKYVTPGPDGKGYCLPFIHNWAILNVKPVGENATEATVHLTTKLRSIPSTPSQPERNMCYVVYRSTRRRCLLAGSVSPNCCSLSDCCLSAPPLLSEILNRQKRPIWRAKRNANCVLYPEQTVKSAETGVQFSFGCSGTERCKHLMPSLSCRLCLMERKTRLWADNLTLLVNEI